MKRLLFAILLLAAIPVYATTSFITEVIDGDTVWADYLGTPEKIRILGIDTPETNECMYDSSIIFVKGLLAETNEVVIISNQDRDKYGRLLAYIILPDGRDVGELLITEGLATYYRDDNYDKKDLYKSLEEMAQTSSLGIWDTNLCPNSVSAPATDEVKEITSSPWWKLFLDFIKQIYNALGL